MLGCCGNNVFHKRSPKSGDSATAANQADNATAANQADNATATNQAIESLLRLVRDVAQTPATGFKGLFRKHCTDLSRRVALLSHLFEEIRDFQDHRESLHKACCSSLFRSSISQLTEALKAAKTLLQSPGVFDHITSRKGAAVEITSLSQFEDVNCKLEKALADFPYGKLDISDDVKEQVNFMRNQLVRATQGNRNGVKKSEKVLKSSDSVDIPDDFLCPISRELMKDPVIVSTGQTYERLYIQRWIESGREICPKTCQKLKNKDLISNHVLKNLIATWCRDNDVNFTQEHIRFC